MRSPPNNTQPSFVPNSPTNRIHLNEAIAHLRAIDLNGTREESFLARAAITILTEVSLTRAMEPDLAGVASE